MSNTPIETAAEAFETAWDASVRASDPDALLNEAETAAFVNGVMRAALASLAQHRDDIARVLWEHDVSQTPWANASDEERALYLSMADAVLAYLTGGAR